MTFYNGMSSLGWSRSYRLFVLDWTVTISVTGAVTDTDTREEAHEQEKKADNQMISNIVDINTLEDDNSEVVTVNMFFSFFFQWWSSKYYLHFNNETESDDLLILWEVVVNLCFVLKLNLCC